MFKKKVGRRPKDVRERTSDRLDYVAAACGLIEEGGVGALTARALAQSLGVAVGTVYNTFDNLESLRLEANAVTMRDLRVVLSDALDACPGGSPEDRLVALGLAYARFANERRNAWTAMLAPRTMEVPPAIAREIADLFGLIGGVLAATGRIPPERLPVTVKALWASVHGMVQLGEGGGLGPIAPRDVPPMLELLVRAAVRGLLADPPA